MSPSTIGSGPPRSSRPRAGRLHLVVMTACLLVALPAHAADHVPIEARAGVADAAAGAAIWASDAFLVYVENDEALEPSGATPRWGYLYYSPSLQKARAYSVRDGKILVAEDLEMTFTAPPVTTGWLDSGAALQLADAEAGTAFCRDHAGQVSTMLLTRGAFQDGDPDQTTWTIIYTAPDAPSLFVVVDATAGKVRRTWRG